MINRKEFEDKLQSHKTIIIEKLREQVKECREKAENVNVESGRVYYSNKSTVLNSEKNQYIHEFEKLASRALERYDVFSKRKLTKEDEPFAEGYIQNLIENPKRSNSFLEYVEEVKYETQNTLSEKSKKELVAQFAERRETYQNRYIKNSRAFVQEDINTLTQLPENDIYVEELSEDIDRQLSRIDELEQTMP